MQPESDRQPLPSDGPEYEHEHAAWRRRQDQRAEDDRMYLDLKGARERLCRAQAFAPAHWRSDLQTALDIVDQAGSAICPDQWSKYDQPEYGGAS